MYFLLYFHPRRGRVRTVKPPSLQLSQSPNPSCPTIISFLFLFCSLISCLSSHTDSASSILGLILDSSAGLWFSGSVLSKEFFVADLVLDSTPSYHSYLFICFSPSFHPLSLPILSFPFFSFSSSFSHSFPPYFPLSLLSVHNSHRESIASPMPCWDAV